MTRAIIFSLLLLLSACSDSSEKTEIKSTQELVQEKAAEVTLSETVQTIQEGLKAETSMDDSSIFSPRELDIVLGAKDSKVTLVEYSSLTCPHCSYYHKEVFPELKKKYIDTNKITYIFREFVSNKQDLDGAIMGRCFSDPKDPLKLFNVLYAQQDNWAFNKNYREILENIGKLAGVTNEKYNECLNNNELLDFLTNNSRSIAFYKGFPGTPSFFINGKIHKGLYSVESLSKELDVALLEVNNDETKDEKPKASNPETTEKVQ